MFKFFKDLGFQKVFRDKFGLKMLDFLWHKIKLKEKIKERYVQVRKLKNLNRIFFSFFLLFKVEKISIFSFCGCAARCRIQNRLLEFFAKMKQQILNLLTLKTTIFKLNIYFFTFSRP